MRSNQKKNVKNCVCGKIEGKLRKKQENKNCQTKIHWLSYVFFKLE